MSNKTIKQLATEHTSLEADDWFMVQKDADSVTGKARASNVFNGGYIPLAYTPDTVTANGNRSYDLVFNSNDLTDTISPGMRLRTARTVAAPDQCTSLNGSTQYWSKSSPSGMTFTDDFSVSAWVYLTSYGAISTIASRYNGTNGWGLFVMTNGTISLRGYNASSGNTSYVSSYQSIPLNKWVHISTQLDMSAFTATTTTSYVMIDGVNVPALVFRSGTNPTALVQAGNLEIGSRNSGNDFFPGKIAQVAIYSAKVTQATHLAAMNQGLSGSETSLISAYSFDGTGDDLSANNNDLTANGSATATNDDSPFGNYGVSTTLDYAIVMKAAFSTNTTLTVQVPEGCTIPTTGGVDAVYYSTQSVPYGFPRSSGKWELLTVIRANYSKSSPTSGTWYTSYTKLTVPLGAWSVGYNGNVYGARASGLASVFVTLAKTDAAEDEKLYSLRPYGASLAEILTPVSRENPETLSTATPFYLNLLTDATGMTSIAVHCNNASMKVYAKNSYL